MNILRILPCLFLLIFTTGVFGQSAPPDARPNILCILVDDLGYGDLSVQGATDMHTPAIDSLARHGLIFTQAYANSTVCSPSRAALLSGRYPDMVGVPGVIRQNPENNWGNLADDAVLLPEVLAANGYRTGMVGKWHLGLSSPDLPGEKGFDHFKGFLGDMMDDYWNHRRGGINWMRLNEQEIDPEGHATDLFTDWAIDFLDTESGSDDPFFLYLAYNAPHFPIQPPAPWLERVQARSPELTEKRAANVAFIEHLDHSIGKVMRQLKESGLEENTLVVFTSDNGGALRYEQRNGNLRGGKQDMYEGGIRVPTYFYWKNTITAGTTTDSPILLMDLFPTFCGVAGATPPKEIDGLDVLPTLLGEEQDTGDRSFYWVRREGGEYGGQAYYAVRHRDAKLLQNTPFEATQYFNVGADPLEAKPLSPDTDTIYSVLHTHLRERIRAAGAVPWQ